jgi:hypothetical protein
MSRCPSRPNNHRIEPQDRSGKERRVVELQSHIGTDWKERSQSNQRKVALLSLDYDVELRTRRV